MTLNARTAAAALHATTRPSSRRSLLPRAAILAAGLGLAMAVTVTPPARAAEHALAGIRIFSPVNTVLSRFGNPTHILTGESAINGFTTNAGTGMSGMGEGSVAPGMPRRGSYPPGAQASYPGAAQGIPAGVLSGGYPGSIPGIGQAAGGAIPPYASGSRPPQFNGGRGDDQDGGGGMGGGAAGATDPSVPTEVMYVYQKPGGVTYDFLLSPNGRVIQITTLGYKSAVKTTRGVALGSGYATVIGKYGYPESQSDDGGILTMNYLQRQHCSFQLRNNKVVGMTVAAVG